MNLSAKDLHWFALANARPWPGFYAFKERFLRRYGRLDGYDLQTIEHECWSCEGSGLRWDGPCDRCCAGVYGTTQHWLERWELAGRIYHRPVSVWEVPWPRPLPVREVEGRIRHEAVPEGVARRAFMRLLLRHEPMNWWSLVVGEAKAGCSARVWRWRMRLARRRNAQDLFPPVNNEEVPF